MCMCKSEFLFVINLLWYLEHRVVLQLAKPRVYSRSLSLATILILRSPQRYVHADGNNNNNNNVDFNTLMLITFALHNSQIERDTQRDRESEQSM
jgi:hypothetical protein